MSTITLQRAAEVTPVQKAVAKLRRDPKLIGYAALLSTMRITEAPIGTARTDTVSYIEVDPDFMAKLTGTMPLFVLVHEVFHKWQGFFPRFELWAKKHPGIPRKKLHAILNMAGDYLINHQLHNAVGLDLPVWEDEDGKPGRVLYTPTINNNVITMEALGDWILANGPPKQPGGGQGQSEPGGGQGQSEPGGGGMDDGNDVALPDMYGDDIEKAPSTGQMKELEATVRRDLANAARAAKAAGDESGFGEMMADESKKDKHNWMQVLYRWAATVRNTGSPSYARPNRRYKIPGGRIQLPSRRSKALGNVCILMDTSGSTMGELISQVMAEVKSVLRNVDFDALYVLHIDTRVQHVDVFKKGDLGKWTAKLYGGGGTYFAPGFQYVKDKLPKMAAIVYHTDGYSGRGDLIECEKIWRQMGQPPVLWALNNMSIDQFKQIAKFGVMMDCQ